MGLPAFVLFLEKFGGEGFIFISWHLSERLYIQELLFVMKCSVEGASISLQIPRQHLSHSEPWQILTGVESSVMRLLL